MLIHLKYYEFILAVTLCKNELITILTETMFPVQISFTRSNAKGSRCIYLLKLYISKHDFAANTLNTHILFGGFPLKVLKIYSATFIT